jgi:hypothetical protein
MRGRMAGMDTIANLREFVAEMDRRIAEVEAEPVPAGDDKALRRRSIRLQELRFNRGVVYFKLSKLEEEEFERFRVNLDSQLWKLNSPSAH